jgi:hypothetical protein
MIAAAALSLMSLAAAEEPKQKWDMTTFTLVLVRPGRSVQDTDPTPAAMQEGHEALLRDLAGKGKALAWGLVEGSPDLLEILVLDVAKPEDAKQLLAEDPWFRSGRRVPEMHPWFAARGILKTSETGALPQRITFGLLRRPGDAPAPGGEAQGDPEGHMAK